MKAEARTLAHVKCWCKGVDEGIVGWTSLQASGGGA